jgi:hypothetical protein
VHVATVGTEIQNGIRDELARAVIGNVTPAPGFVNGHTLPSEFVG